MPDPADPAETTFAAPGAKRATKQRELDAGDAVRPDDVAPPPTELEAILGELVTELEAEATLPVPERPGWAVVYNIDVDHRLLGRWQRASRDTDLPNNIDELKYTLTFLAALCRRIIRQGKVVELAGEAVTFRSREFQKLLGARDANEAVRKVYGRDAHVLTAGAALLREAGYTEEQVADPLASSSTD
jgi:hypothetical protein